MTSQAQPGDHSLDWILPVNRDGFAIAAGYFGLLSFIPLPFFSLPALVCGLLALYRIDRTGKLGRGRAMFALVMGVVSLGFFLFILMLGSRGNS